MRTILDKVPYIESSLDFVEALLQYFEPETLAQMLVDLEQYENEEGYPANFVRLCIKDFPDSHYYDEEDRRRFKSAYSMLTYRE